MSINFFEKNCQTTTNVKQFGICDDNDEQPAYFATNKKEDWVASVNNATEKTVTFTAIDKCVFKHDEKGNDESRCDCMLTYTDNIVFIELKDQRKEWIAGAIEQIEATINSYKANHDITAFKHKRAFVANKRHPHFHVIEDETMKRFFNEHRVRLNVQAEIIIK